MFIVGGAQERPLIKGKKKVLTRKPQGLRGRLALALASVVASTVLAGSIALAHTGTFTMWAYNVEIWAGQVNHYKQEFECCGFPYDYMIPMNVAAIQYSAGSFYFTQFQTPPGNEFGVPGWKFTLNVYGPGHIYQWSGWECDPVTQSGNHETGVFVASGTGAWEQSSGGGNVGCWGSYMKKDAYIVSGQ